MSGRLYILGNYFPSMSGAVLGTGDIAWGFLQGISGRIISELHPVYHSEYLRLPGDSRHVIVYIYAAIPSMLFHPASVMGDGSIPSKALAAYILQTLGYLSGFPKDPHILYAMTVLGHPQYHKRVKQACERTNVILGRVYRLNRPLSTPNGSSLHLVPESAIDTINEVLKTLLAELTWKT